MVARPIGPWSTGLGDCNQDSSNCEYIFKYMYVYASFIINFSLINDKGKKDSEFYSGDKKFLFYEDEKLMTRERKIQNLNSGIKIFYHDPFLYMQVA